MRRSTLRAGWLAVTTGALLCVSGLALPGDAAAERWKNLAAPQQLLDGEKPINVDIGHAAPAVFDFDRDGKKDLLVGQFDGGKCRIYLNQGTNREPRFSGFRYLTVNGTDATVPYG